MPWLAAMDCLFKFVPVCGKKHFTEVAGPMFELLIASNVSNIEQTFGMIIPTHAW